MPKFEFFKEIKNKVGRPKLADDDIIKKARISIICCLIIIVVMAFSFISIMYGTSPYKMFEKIAGQKLFGSLNNKNSFIVKEYYDDNQDYVININTKDGVNKYSGSYKYTLYELKNNSWIEKESKTYDNKTTSFNIKVESLANENKTYKIKLQILNAALIKESFAPKSWTFSDSEKNEEKAAYKVFTVKGYYSPINVKEIKEAAKSKNKITISTTKKDVRKFTLNVSSHNYSVSVIYTDNDGRSIVLKKDDNLINETYYEVPNFNYSTYVTFKIWITDLNDVKSLKKLSLSNWKIKKDKNGKYYVYNTYFLKPEKAYKR